MNYQRFNKGGRVAKSPFLTKSLRFLIHRQNRPDILSAGEEVYIQWHRNKVVTTIQAIFPLQTSHATKLYKCIFTALLASG